MGYYPSSAEGEKATRIYFLNGMNNKLDGAQQIASTISGLVGVPVGVIANDTHGIASDTLEYLKIPQTKDVLNEYTYRKLDQSGEPTLIVIHGAGNNDVVQALNIGRLHNHQYPNLSFYSLGSPISSNKLDQAVTSAGANYVGQVNDWRDPVTYSKTAVGGMISAAGAGALYGCSFGTLGCLAGATTGGGMVGAPVLLGLANYHVMSNYLGKSEVMQTLQQWQNRIR